MKIETNKRVIEEFKKQNKIKAEKAKTAETATFEDLIKKKMKKEEFQNRRIDIYIPSIDRKLIFKTPDDDYVIEFMNKIEDENDIAGMVESFKELIYLTCETLQNPELHEKLDVKDPFDIVSTLFTKIEIMDIGDQLMDAMDPEGKVGEIKN